MIKRISFKGISNSPSDCIAEDGYLIDALNVMHENGELAPITPNEFVGNMQGSNIICKHKGSFISYAHDNGVTNFYSNKIGDDGSIITTEIGSVQNELVIYDSSCDGNVISVATNAGMKYIILDDGVYTILGDFPELYVDISSFSKHYMTSEEYGDPYLKKRYKRDDIEYSLEYVDSLGGDNRVYQLYKDGEAYEKEFTADNRKDIISQMHQMATNVAQQYGLFVTPMIVSYAIRLFDGTIVDNSKMNLIDSPLFDQTNGNSGVFIIESSNKMTVYVSPYNIGYNVFVRNEYTGWDKMIESVDIFAAPVDCYDQTNKEFVTRTVWGKSITQIVTSDTILDTSIKNLSGLYLIGSHTFKDAGNSDFILANKDGKDINNIYLFEKMHVAGFSGISYVPENILSYNNRLHIYNVSEVFRKQDMRSPVVKIETSDIEGVDGNGHYTGLYYRVHLNVNGKNVVKTESVYLSIGSPKEIIRVFYPRLISYPDFRATRIELISVRCAENRGYKMLTKTYTYDMKRVTSLNYSYLLRSESLVNETGREEYIDDLQRLFDGDTDCVRYDNTLMVSNASNPFVFPSDFNVTLPGRIIGVATAKKAISEGQFGQFPLYCFLDNGVWALSVSSGYSSSDSVSGGDLGEAGIYSSKHPVSDDVCNNPKSIINVDGGVVFSTDKGIMVIYGSTTKLLTPFAVGDMRYAHEYISHRFAKESEISIFDLSPYLAYLSSDHILVPQTDDSGNVTDKEIQYTKMSLSEYSKDADFILDSKNDKLCVARTGSLYAYLVDLKTGYLTKMCWSDSEVFASYPDSYIHLRATGDLFKFNVKTDTKDVYSGLLELRYFSMFMTRPISLDSHDVLKSISRLRLRGYFKHPDYRPLVEVYGSRDGYNFYRIRSLRGQGYKQFIFMFLASHDWAGVNVSYVDIDFEYRQNNRLR